MSDHIGPAAGCSNEARRSNRIFLIVQNCRTLVSCRTWIRTRTKTLSENRQIEQYVGTGQLNQASQFSAFLDQRVRTTDAWSATKSSARWTARK